MSEWPVSDISALVSAAAAVSAAVYAGLTYRKARDQAKRRPLVIEPEIHSIEYPGGWRICDLTIRNLEPVNAVVSSISSVEPQAEILDEDTIMMRDGSGGMVHDLDRASTMRGSKSVSLYLRPSAFRPYAPDQPSPEHFASVVKKRLLVRNLRDPHSLRIHWRWADGKQD